MNGSEEAMLVQCSYGRYWVVGKESAGNMLRKYTLKRLLTSAAMNSSSTRSVLGLDHPHPRYFIGDARV